jgi:hypothetical protein
VAAEGARARGLQIDSKKKHSRAFIRWTAFIQSIGIANDPFLDNFLPSQRTRLVGAFAHAVRTAEYSRNRNHPLAASTVRDTISALSAAFAENDRDDPVLNSQGKTHRILQLQFTSYRNDDPAPKSQRALTLDFIIRVFLEQGTPVDCCFGPLLVLAFFFALRSCEYLTVTGPRKTKLLRVRDIRFFLNKADITHNLASLHRADIVCVTFQDQKNGEKSETITMSCTNDPIACPVIQAATIVNRVLTIPGATPDSSINTYRSGNITFQLSSATALTRLRKKADEIGPEILGHDPDDIGLHSARSAAAMAMILAGTPTYMVMLIGRWKSDAFLAYIRKQVAEFSNQVSSNMIRIMTFFHPPTTALVSRTTIAGREAQAMATLPRIN